MEGYHQAECGGSEADGHRWATSVPRCVGSHLLRLLQGWSFRMLLREWGVTERMNLLLMRIGYIVWVAQNDGQSFNNFLDQLCFFVSLKSAYW